VGLLNVNGFYDNLNLLLQTMVHQGFLKEVNYKMLLVSNDIDDLLHQMNTYVAPEVGKWISKDKV
jgi:predicted Rossmann-fold nucleotide-binding protein